MKNNKCIKIEQEWISIENELPEKDYDIFYGDRYSIPVIVSNINTGRILIIPYMYDYRFKGWVLASLEDGPDPEDYDTVEITHWMRYPKNTII